MRQGEWVLGFLAGAAVMGADTSGTVSLDALRLLFALLGFEQAAATIPRMASKASVLTNLDRGMDSPKAQRNPWTFDTYPPLPASERKNLTPVSGQERAVRESKQVS